MITSLLLTKILCLHHVVTNDRYGDRIFNTSEENYSVFSLSECTSCCQQGHVGSKTLFQQNYPVLNRRWHA